MALFSLYHDYSNQISFQWIKSLDILSLHFSFRTHFYNSIFQFTCMFINLHFNQLIIVTSTPRIKTHSCVVKEPAEGMQRQNQSRTSIVILPSSSFTPSLRGESLLELEGGMATWPMKLSTDQLDQYVKTCYDIVSIDHLKTRIENVIHNRKSVCKIGLRGSYGNTTQWIIWYMVKHVLQLPYMQTTL